MEVDLCELLLSMKLEKPVRCDARSHRPSLTFRGGRKAQEGTIKPCFSQQAAKTWAWSMQQPAMYASMDVCVRYIIINSPPAQRGITPESKSAIRTALSRMRIPAGYPVPTRLRELPNNRRRIRRVHLHPSPNILRVSRRTPLLCAGFQ